MIRRQSIVASRTASSLRTTREKRIAVVRRFWLDLNARLGQARKHGVTLEEATRRLEEREAKQRLPKHRRAAAKKPR